MLAYNPFLALSHGLRSANFMDVTIPAVAATQFTACTAMSNLVTSYTAWWQGLSIAGWGYPVTLLIDSIVGLFGLFLLPMMKPVRVAQVAPTDAEGPRIAR